MELRRTPFPSTATSPLPTTASNHTRSADSAADTDLFATPGADA
ncbi:hypothetical protein AB0J94_29100 [Micromonospora noduli]|nr:hypothetical protein [Micromonospora noduli]